MPTFPGTEGRTFEVTGVSFWVDDTSIAHAVSTRFEGTDLDEASGTMTILRCEPTTLCGRDAIGTMGSLPASATCDACMDLWRVQPGVKTYR